MSFRNGSGDGFKAVRIVRRRGHYALLPGPADAGSLGAENERALVLLTTQLSSVQTAAECAYRASLELAQLFGADGISVELQPAQGDTCTTHWGCRLPETSPGAVHSSVLFLPDLDPRQGDGDLASLLIIPLAQGREWTGTLKIGWRRAPVTLEASDLSFAVRVAQIVTTIIIQARRYEKLEADHSLLGRLKDDLIDLANSWRAETAYLRDNHNKLHNEYLELQATARSLEALAERDGLTGLYNHRSFHNRLREEISRAERSQQPLVLAILDVDFLKSYNDTYGHLAGDKVLATLGRLLKECVRGCDFVARYGGEEFTVLFPTTELKRAVKVAERLRRAVAAHPFDPCSLTLSVGLASFRPGQSSHDLIEKADQALYEAKAAGRNQVRIHRAAAEPKAA